MQVKYNSILAAKPGMQIYHNVDEIVFDNRRAITIGNFDGVHLGHQKILSTLLRCANEKQLSPFVITFSVSPKAFFADVDFPVLTPIGEKLDIFQCLGVAEVLVLDFNEETSQMSPNFFIADFIMKHIGVGLFVVGENHSFGKNNAGNSAFLKQLAKSDKCQFFDVVTVGSVAMDGVIVSSTLIRNQIKIQDIEAVNQMLGYQYQVRGIVESGKQLGRKLGFPTANLSIERQKSLPKNGVYLCSVALGKPDFYRNDIQNISHKHLVGLANIDSNRLSKVEVHILDFNGDIYGETITIYLQQFVRDEMQFDSEQALSEQIRKDILLCRGIIG